MQFIILVTVLRSVMSWGGSASCHIQKVGLAQPPDTFGAFGTRRAEVLWVWPRAVSDSISQVQSNILADLPEAITK